ncbi:MAG: endo-1,4-beta-xylanase [Opitutales bacterium]|nr:endo-1,4-beta-xylanase [Opitutales bacterium]MCH8541475.1 endo-1,4-beta-xylanase [Opitutales bacterium]
MNAFSESSEGFVEGVGLTDYEDRWTSTEVGAELDFSEVEAFHEEKARIRGMFGRHLSSRDRETLVGMMKELDRRQKNALQVRAKEEGLAYEGSTDDGRGFRLQGFEDGEPVYLYTTNMIQGAESAGVAPWVRWNADFDPAVGAHIDGEGLVANVLELGTIYPGHQEFSDDEGNSRILIYETEPTGSSGSREHATQVSSVLGAWGKDANAIGIAPRVSFRTFGSGAAETVVYASGKAHPAHFGSSVVTNRSIGGSPNTMYNFASRDIDRALFDTPYHLLVNSAGNNGSNFQTLGGGPANAKNTLSIGETRALFRDEDGNYESGGSIVGASSRGPTADGRIKPDLVTRADGLRAARSGTSTYRNSSGTSFSSPLAAGTVMLLADHFQQRFPERFPRSSTIRALMINGADDLGNPGPDYVYGYGAINVLASARLIRDYADNPESRLLVEDALEEGSVWTQDYTVEESGRVRVALSWLDPAFSSQSFDRVLVNNLHVKVIGPDTTEYLPYVMPYALDDTASFSAHAVQAENPVDPNLLVEIPNAEAGSYTVEVYNDGDLLDGLPQEFSLAVSGMAASGASQPEIYLEEPLVLTEERNQMVRVPVSEMLVGATVRLERMGSSPIDLEAVGREEGKMTFYVDPADMDLGYWDLHLLNPDGSEVIEPRALLVNAASAFHVFWDMQSDPGFALESDGDVSWSFGEPGGIQNDPLFGPFGPQVLGTNPGANYSGSFDVSAISPVIDFSEASDLLVNVYHWINKEGSVAADFAVQVNGGSWESLWANSFMTRWNRWLLLNSGNPWSEGPIALPSSVEGQSEVRFRFRLQRTTSSSTQDIGWYIGGFEIAQEAVSVLYPPVFTSEPVTQTETGQLYSYSAEVSDADTPLDELTWSLEEGPTWLSLSDNGDGSALLSGNAEMGTHSVKVRVSDGDYDTWQAFTLEVEGSLEEPEITEWPTASDLVYVQTLAESTLSGGESSVAGSFVFTSPETTPDAGTSMQSVTFVPEDTAMYASVVGEVEVTVEPVEATVNLSDMTRTYDSTPLSPTVTTTPEGLTVDLTFDGGTGVPVNVGSYEVVATVNDPNAAGVASGTFAIEASALAVTAEDQVKAFGEDDPELTWTVTNGQLWGSDSLSGELTREPGEDPGEYAITQGDLSASVNYDLTFVPGTLTIEPGEILINLIRPTTETVRIPEGVGLVLETEITEEGGESGTLALAWTQESGEGDVSWEATDSSETVAWFSAQGEYTLRLTADNEIINEVLDITVEVVDPALINGEGQMAQPMGGSYALEITGSNDGVTEGDFAVVTEGNPLPTTTVSEAEGLSLSFLGEADSDTPVTVSGSWSSISYVDGAEYNLRAAVSASSGPDAISKGAFVEFAVETDGSAVAAFDLNAFEVDLWRNGSGAAQYYQFAIESDGDWTLVGDVFDVGEGHANSTTLRVEETLYEETSEAKIRLYYWDASTNGNTHYYGVRADVSGEGGYGLPEGWDSITFGSPNQLGEETWDDNGLEIAGSDGDFWSSDDGGHFVYTAVSGDVDLRANLSSFEAVDGGSVHQYAKAVVMIRDTLEDQSYYGFMGVQQDALRRQVRSSFSSNPSNSSHGSLSQYPWFRITRTGDNLRFYRSSDGLSWNEVGTATTLGMGEEVFVGMAVSSHPQSGGGDDTAIALFESIELNGQLIEPIFGGAPQNIGPFVDAGDMQIVTVNTEVSLSGSVEDDGLPEDPGIVTTEWIQLSGPEMVTLSDAFSVAPSFTPSETGDYVFRLVAFDGEVATANDTTIEVEESSGPPPPQPGSVAFDSETFTFAEDAGTVQIPVSRSGGSDGAVTIKATHEDDSALAGEHFEAVEQTLSWADGEDGARMVELTILPQSGMVGDRTLSLSLSDPTGDLALGTPVEAAITLEGPGQPILIDFDDYNSYGQISVTTEPDGTKTLEITAAGEDNPWNSAFRWPVDEPLYEGEVLWLRIVGYASHVPGEETGEMQVPTMVERQESPFTRYLNGTMRFGPQSGEQILIGVMTEDQEADMTYINMQVGGLEGTLHIESVELVRYPPGTDPADLPQSPIIWEGMEEEASWRDQAEADIQANRTSDFSIRIVDASGNPVEGLSVTAIQENHAFAFGTAVNNRQMLDPDLADGETYRQRLVENFEWATVENSLKWEAEDWGTWGDADNMAERGQATVDKIVELGLIPRGHVLLWPSYNNSPGYLEGLSNEDLAVEIENRVRSMSAQYAGVIPEWDALNEIWSNNDFPELLGYDLLEDVFTWAREEDSEARFFINDYSILSNGNLHSPQKDFYYDLIDDLQTAGVPLGGIGMQGHFGGNMPGVSEMKATLDRFADFGLPIRITEYDHDILDEEAQANFFRDVLTLTFAHEAVDGFFVWGFWDGRHWKDNAPFYREDWSEKPALAYWQGLVYDEWWTGEVSDTTNADGWVTISGAFHGDYRVEVEGLEEVESFHLSAENNELLIEFPATDPFEEWLVQNELDGEDEETYTLIKNGREVTLREAYLLGDDPHDPSDVLRITVAESTEPDSMELRFEALEGRVYRVEYSDDLVTWEPYGDIEIHGNEEDHVVTVGRDSAQNPRRFYRVRVSFPE